MQVRTMFVKRIDGRDYAFRMYWDAATSGPHYWMVVEAEPQPEAGYVPFEPMPEEAVSKLHRLLEKYAGFPNVPAPIYEDEGKTIRFKVRIARTPNGARPRSTSDWMKVLERTIQVEL